MCTSTLLLLDLQCITMIMNSVPQSYRRWGDLRTNIHEVHASVPANARNYGTMIQSSSNMADREHACARWSSFRWCDCPCCPHSFRSISSSFTSFMLLLLLLLLPFSPAPPPPQLLFPSSSFPILTGHTTAHPRLSCTTTAELTSVVWGGEWLIVHMCACMHACVCLFVCCCIC